MAAASYSINNAGPFFALAHRSGKRQAILLSVSADVTLGYSPQLTLSPVSLLSAPLVRISVAVLVRIDIVSSALLELRSWIASPVVLLLQQYLVVLHCLIPI